ncbi:MAG: 50S ribosomal protein L21 [Eubacteriales bacterium]
MYAIIETGGKQYKVSGGDIIYVEKLDVPEGDTVIIDKVLAYSDGGVLEVGSPYTEYKCEASVVKNGKGKKLRIIRYKPKKNQKRHMGHRQPYTKLQILTFSK